MQTRICDRCKKQSEPRDDAYNKDWEELTISICNNMTKYDICPECFKSMFPDDFKGMPIETYRKQLMSAFENFTA